jgi:branched-chain amino acid transport system substrate-binding protein
LLAPCGSSSHESTSSSQHIQTNAANRFTSGSSTTGAPTGLSGSDIIAEIVGTIELAKTKGRKHVGVLYCAESPICAQIIPLVNAAGALSGVKITTGKVSSTAPNYTAQCLSLKSAGVDALFVGAGSPVVQRVAASCAQQGYRPATVNTTSTATNAWRSDKNLDGAVLSAYGANVFDEATPAIKEFRAAQNKYDPGLLTNGQFGANLIGVWAGGKLFEAAAKAAHIAPQSTSADVKKGLYALQSETLGGLTAPLTFTPGKPTFTPCYFTVQLKGGNFISLNGNRPTCLPTAVTTALMESAPPRVTTSEPRAPLCGRRVATRRERTGSDSQDVGRSAFLGKLRSSTAAFGGQRLRIWQRADRRSRV